VLLIFENKDLFATDMSQLPGTSTVVHHIDTGDAKPTTCRPYRHSVEAKAEIRRQMQEMYENDLIRPSTSPWSSPVILVKKPHSKEFKFTVDYRRLNAVTRPMFYPLPTIDEIRDVLAAKPPVFYTLLDCRSGYWQCTMSRESQEKLPFVHSIPETGHRTVSFSAYRELQLPFKCYDDGIGGLTVYELGICR